MAQSWRWYLQPNFHIFIRKMVLQLKCTFSDMTLNILRRYYLRFKMRQSHGWSPHHLDPDVSTSEKAKHWLFLPDEHAKQKHILIAQKHAVSEYTPFYSEIIRKPKVNYENLFLTETSKNRTETWVWRDQHTGSMSDQTCSRRGDFQYKHSHQLSCSNTQINLAVPVPCQHRGLYARFLLLNPRFWLFSGKTSFCQKAAVVASCLKSCSVWFLTKVWEADDRLGSRSELS